MIKIVLLLILYGFFITIFAQNNTGNIKGVIKTPAGSPAELVNVSLKEKQIGSFTNSRGEYEINGIEVGKYMLEVSFVGFKTVVMEIEVTPGQTTEVPEIIMEETAAELSEITIRDNRINKYAVLESDYVSKLPLKNLENPQSYSTTTRELLSSQGITDYSSALKTIPGGAISAESPQGLSSIYIRGFITNSFIRNGIYSFNWNGGDPQVIEQIEIIRGPSGPVFVDW